MLLSFSSSEAIFTFKFKETHKSFPFPGFFFSTLFLCYTPFSPTTQFSYIFWIWAEAGQICIPPTLCVKQHFCWYTKSESFEWPIFICTCASNIFLSFVCLFCVFFLRFCMSRFYFQSSFPMQYHSIKSNIGLEANDCAEVQQWGLHETREGNDAGDPICSGELRLRPSRMPQW